MPVTGIRYHTIAGVLRGHATEGDGVLPPSIALCLASSPMQSWLQATMYTPTTKRFRKPLEFSMCPHLIPLLLRYLIAD